MQQLTAAPRGNLTVEQVRQLLVGAAHVDYTRGLELLTADLTFLDDISGDFEGGQVIRDMNATVHGTCALKLARDIDYGTQLVRPYLTLTADGVAGQFYGGVFVLSKPTTDHGTVPPSNAVSGKDRLSLLDRPIGTSYVVHTGVGYITAAYQVFADAGVTGVLIDGTASALTLPAPMLWPQMATGTSSGPTTWLMILNDLFAAINYRGVWADEAGLYRSQPYVDPSRRAPEFAFDFDDLRVAVVAPQRSDAQDFSTVPNVWVFTQQNLVDTSGASLEPSEGSGQYTVDHSQDTRAPGYRGGLRWPTVVQLTAADQASLVAQGDAQVAADERVTRVLNVQCAPFPVAGHWDVYTYSDVELGGAMTVEETQWTLDFGSGTSLPADMTRVWTVV